MKIKAITEQYWHQILEIQNQSYRDVGTEELTVLKSKHNASPDTCFVCVSGSGMVLGYVLAHPWGGIALPKLFEPLEKINNSEYLYLHDLAVIPELKGKGVGKALASKLFEVAQNKGVNEIKLVAVQGAQSYWIKLGFTEVKGANTCASYGEGAILMEKQLTV